MVLKRTGFVFVLASMLCLVALSATAGDGLDGNIEAFKVAKNENGKEIFLSARTAHPQDVIEYRLTYKNKGSEPVKNVAIVDPVPFGTVCIPGSAKSPAGGVEFSVDGGKSFHAWPVMIPVRTADGGKQLKEATPDMITHVRWVVAGTLDPENEVTVSYRASVR